MCIEIQRVSSQKGKWSKGASGQKGKWSKGQVVKRASGVKSGRKKSGQTRERSPRDTRAVKRQVVKRAKVRAVKRQVVKRAKVRAVKRQVVKRAKVRAVKWQVVKRRAVKRRRLACAGRAGTAAATAPGPAAAGSPD